MNGDPAKIVRKATDDDLRQLDIVGGDPILVHVFDAWKATPSRQRATHCLCWMHIFKSRPNMRSTWATRPSSTL